MLWELLAAAALMTSPQVQPAKDCVVQHVRVATAVSTAEVPVPDGWSVTTECTRGPDDPWGRTYHGERRIALWPAGRPMDGLHNTLLHEIGHVRGAELSDMEKVHWIVERDGEWTGDWSSWRCEDHDCPNMTEDWAASFAFCQGHRDPSRHQEWYGPVPEPHECETMGRLLR